MLELLKKYRSVILYAVFGILTTVVNIASYYVAAHWVGFSTLLSNVLAWTLAVLFAYITNRKYVFESQAKDFLSILRELFNFILARLATGIFDWIFMYICVDILQFNDLLIKTVSNIIVIVLNYVFSKLIVFKKRR